MEYTILQDLAINHLILKIWVIYVKVVWHWQRAEGTETWKIILYDIDEESQVCYTFHGKMKRLCKEAT